MARTMFGENFNRTDGQSNYGTANRERMTGHNKLIGERGVDSFAARRRRQNIHRAEREWEAGRQRAWWDDQAFQGYDSSWQKATAAGQGGYDDAFGLYRTGQDWGQKHYASLADQTRSGYAKARDHLNPIVERGEWGHNALMGALNDPLAYRKHMTGALSDTWFGTTGAFGSNATAEQQRMRRNDIAAQAASGYANWDDYQAWKQARASSNARGMGGPMAQAGAMIAAQQSAANRQAQANALLGRNMGYYDQYARTGDAMRNVQSGLYGTEANLINNLGIAQANNYNQYNALMGQNRMNRGQYMSGMHGQYGANQFNYLANRGEKGYGSFLRHDQAMRDVADWQLQASFQDYQLDKQLQAMKDAQKSAGLNSLLSGGMKLFGGMFG